MAGRRPLPAAELLVRHARAHRDLRNLALHRVGVPMLMFGAAALLARAQIGFGGRPLSLAWAAWGLACAWFLSRGHLGLGLIASLGSAALVALAQPVAAGGTVPWLAIGLSALLLGALMQRAGHYYEGRRAAFAGDLASLLAPPLFVAAEGIFACGRGRALAAEIERRAGPSVLRDLAHPREPA
jgi:uncharacterized membrane protein YGL010W